MIKERADQKHIFLSMMPAGWQMQDLTAPANLINRYFKNYEGYLLRRSILLIATTSTRSHQAL